LSVRIVFFYKKNPGRGSLRLRTIPPTSANDAFDQELWETFVTTAPGLKFPVLASLTHHNHTPPTNCGTGGLGAAQDGASRHDGLRYEHEAADEIMIINNHDNEED
jgi:hypothetical protein